ncbi:hypothetical protein N0V88_005426 [Collariella sp. IMI 366227]|nr:hypothetical protein N0V88_005426 [Collariella sp. IMI 366227]
MAAPNGHGITHGLEIADSTALQGSQADLDGFGPNLGMLATGPGSAFASPQTPSYGSPMGYSIGFQYAQPNRFPNGIKLEDGLYSAANGGFPGPMSPSPFINGNQPTLAVRNLPQPAPLNLPLMNKTNGTASAGSCCSSKTPAAPTRNNSGLAQQMYSQPYVPKRASGSGCCSSKAQTPSPTANTPTSQQMLEQAYMTPFPYPTVFTYPGDYGSWQQPIDPVIWQQVASQTTMPLNKPLAPTTTPTSGTDTTTGAAGTSHQCSCGAGCQCVGCLAHPFNAQMFQYVNNAYSDGGNNGSNVGSPVNGDGSQPPPQQPQQQQHLSHHQQQMQTPANGHAHPHSGQDTPQEAPTPAASEGSPREEQALSTLDYFFVDLPISGLCGGSMETCPRPDDDRAEHRHRRDTRDVDRRRNGGLMEDERSSKRRRLEHEDNHERLSRSDLTSFKPLFAHYLDLQKQLDVNTLNDTELRGRWKSFMGKWNRGELAEGWYDPEVFQRAAEDYPEAEPSRPPAPPTSPPNATPNTPTKKPSSPTSFPARGPGSHERRLEKKREITDKMKGFARERSPGYKAMVRKREEVKRERVGRREEMERARRAERDERVRVGREREEKVVEELRSWRGGGLGVPES